MMNIQESVKLIIYNTVLSNLNSIDDSTKDQLLKLNNRVLNDMCKSNPNNSKDSGVEHNEL